MSGYQYYRVIRLPLPPEFESLRREETLEGHLRQKLGDLFGRGPKRFEIVSTQDATYIDWVFASSYEVESGDWGSVSLVPENILGAIRPLFDKLGISYRDKDLRLVSYCYYNCCEAPDYYALPVLTSQEVLP